MLYLPDGGVTAPEWTELARRIQQGDGVWGGDERLELRLGVVERRGRVIGRRLEVWRYNEDGSESRIGFWKMEEQFRILHDLAQMRLDRPGGGDVLDRIDRHNDRLEEEQRAKQRDQMAVATERLAYAMMRKQGHARNRFGIDRNPLAKD